MGPFFKLLFALSLDFWVTTGNWLLGAFHNTNKAQRCAEFPWLLLKLKEVCWGLVQGAEQQHVYTSVPPLNGTKWEALSLTRITSRSGEGSVNVNLNNYRARKVVNYTAQSLSRQKSFDSIWGKESVTQRRGKKEKKETSNKKHMLGGVSSFLRREGEEATKNKAIRWKHSSSSYYLSSYTLTFVSLFFKSRNWKRPLLPLWKPVSRQFSPMRLFFLYK